MAEIRHLENRHDVMFLYRGWSDLDKISDTDAEWHVESTAVMWSKSKPDVEFQYGGRWANSMACHPRATCHIAGCCHLVNLFHSHEARATCYIAGCSHLAKSLSWSCDRVKLQNVRISSALLKIVFRHILFLFLMQFRLWRAAAFVSSPIYLFQS